jgi:hypothetical protein
MCRTPYEGYLGIGDHLLPLDPFEQRHVLFKITLFLAQGMVGPTSKSNAK